MARVRLIHDLRRGMDIGEDAIPLVLSLLDQVYELRSRLKSVLHAVEAQPRDVQLAILAAMESRPGADRHASRPAGSTADLVRRELESGEDGVGRA